jgi:hypothetical protein
MTQIEVVDGDDVLAESLRQPTRLDAGHVSI